MRDILPVWYEQDDGSFVTNYPAELYIVVRKKRALSCLWLVFISPLASEANISPNKDTLIVYIVAANPAELYWVVRKKRGYSMPVTHVFIGATSTWSCKTHTSSTKKEGTHMPCVHFSTADEGNIYPNILITNNQSLTETKKGQWEFWQPMIL